MMMSCLLVDLIDSVFRSCTLLHPSSLAGVYRNGKHHYGRPRPWIKLCREIITEVQGCWCTWLPWNRAADWRRQVCSPCLTPSLTWTSSMSHD